MPDQVLNSNVRLPPRLVRQDSRRKYKAMIETAGDLFINRGYGNTSMELVAATAGVSKRTLYSHFENKEALFAAVIKALCANIVPPTIAEIGGVDGSIESVLTKLGIIFLTNICSPEQIQMFGSLLNESRQFPQVGLMMLEGPVQRSQELISKYLHTCIRAGQLELAEPDLAAAHFMGLLKADLQMRLLFNQKVNTSKAEIKRVVVAAVDLFLNGALSRRKPVATTAEEVFEVLG